MRRHFILTLLILCWTLTAVAADSSAGAAAPAPALSPVAGNPEVLESLLNLMVSKGMLTAPEVASVRSMPVGQQLTPLLALLAKKGMLSQDELAALNGSAAPASTPTPALPIAKPTVVAALAPLRVLPVEAPKKDGLIPDFRLGPVKLKPYGMIKASAIYDSSSPRGTDMPVPFFIFGDTGPDASPEFHVKARFL